MPKTLVFGMLDFNTDNGVSVAIERRKVCEFDAFRPVKEVRLWLHR